MDSLINKILMTADKFFVDLSKPKIPIINIYLKTIFY